MSAQPAASASPIPVTTGTFDDEVLRRSASVPVLVDFWAPWCGPCRMLGPILDRLAGELAGQLVVAKVNTDEEPELAGRYQISGIPAVKLFRDGQVVDEFTGAVPEAAIREFLGRHIVSEADAMLERAVAVLATGKTEESRALIEEVLAEEPTHQAARLMLARLFLAQGNVDEARAQLDQLTAVAAADPDAQALSAALEFASACSDTGGEDACRARVEADPDDASAHLDLGLCLAATAHYPEALDELLASVAIDRKLRDEAARKAMVTIFRLVGNSSEMANDYRRRLTIYL